MNQTDTVKECNRFITALQNREHMYNRTMYEQNINFAEMVIKIYHHTQNVNNKRSEKEALLIELQSIKNIVYRDWLDLKIKEL